MILVLCAMKEEFDLFIENAKDIKHLDFLTLENYRNKTDLDKIGLKPVSFKVKDKQVVVSVCGVGKVYSAISATRLIEKLKPDLVINTGCAGCLDKNISINDVIVANKVSEWDVRTPGLNIEIEEDYCTNFIDLDLDLINNLNKKYDNSIKIGHIVSADAFVNYQDVDYILNRYSDAIACEMEGAAIAKTCRSLNVKSLIIRSISDLTYKKNNEKDFELNFMNVLKKSTSVTYDIIYNIKV